MFDRIYERHGPHQVGGEFLSQKPALMKSLTHKTEMELLEVPESAVDELR
jgi:hypothetical protein